MPTSKYQTAHYDPTSDILILRLTTTTQIQYFKDILSVQRAFIASVRVIQGLPDTTDPDKPPKNYKAAMSRPDNQEPKELKEPKFLQQTCNLITKSTTVS
jgi:hypothetical protein